MKQNEEWIIRIFGLISMLTTLVGGCMLSYKVLGYSLTWTCKASAAVGGWFLNILKKKGFDTEEA